MGGFNNPFAFPTAPVPRAATLGASLSSMSPPGSDTGEPHGADNCPSGQMWNGQRCVHDPNAPGSGGGGACPEGTPAGPASCCPPGQVYRTDTKSCEPPDQRSGGGKETCVGVRPQCPPGQDVWCDFDDAQFKCAQSQFSDADLCGRQNRIRRDRGLPKLPCDQLGFGGAGGRGGAAGGSGTAAKPMPGGASTDFDALLRKYIEDNLKAPSRYTPQALQALYGQITSQSAGAIRRGTAAVQQNAAQRGMQRAGSTGAAIQDVRNSAEQQRGAAVVGVQLDKIKADHDDKMGALDRAQKYLDSLRDNEYRYTLMGEQRRQFDANLALAYANLAQQRSMLQMQLQSQWDMLSAQQGFLLATGGV